MKLLKELFERLLVEMKYVSDVNEVIYDEGIMCISGLIEWDEINRCFEDVDVSIIEDEVKDFIRCEIYSDEDVLYNILYELKSLIELLIKEEEFKVGDGK